MAFLLLLPLLMLPAVVPHSVELILRMTHDNLNVPVALILTIVELAVIIFAYYHLLDFQGQLLHRREQKILAAVITKAE